MAGLIGHELGNFMLTEVLGTGGMGTVYLAEHKWIARKKAVKVLSEEASAHSSLVRRFFDEATAASACQHDHIVNIEDCGTFYHGGKPHHYIEMEYLEGHDVAAACRSTGRFPDLDGAVKIVAYAADALSAAHERGIVHRDLKPENIFLARRGRRTDYVKVLDFGIARLTGELSSGHKTRTGSVMGTPEYMSPEQANGLHPDGKSDVWSLGVVLYRMLTGKVPFEGDTFTLLAVKINHDAPPAVRRYRPEVPEGVTCAVELALQKRPADRPTMVEFMQLLLAGDAAPRAVMPELSIATPAVFRPADSSPSMRSAPTHILPTPQTGPRGATPPRSRGRR